MSRFEWSDDDVVFGPEVLARRRWCGADFEEMEAVMNTTLIMKNRQQITEQEDRLAAILESGDVHRMRIEMDDIAERILTGKMRQLDTIAIAILTRATWRR